MWKNPEKLEDRIPVTDCDLKVLKDCGFNLVFGNSQKWLFPEETKVSGISFCPVIPGTTSSNSNVFIGNLETYQVIDSMDENGKIKTPRNKNFSMLGFQDEPSISQLEKMRVNYKEARDIHLPQLPFFSISVSAEPSAPIPAGVAEKLENYLDEVQQWLLPAVWCYDYYPIQCNFRLTGSYTDYKDEAVQDDLKNITTLDPSGEIFVNFRTFLWLEIFMKRAKETDTPFWYVGLSREFQGLMCKPKDENGNEEPSYILRRYANETYMRFTTFSALAYGAKGLVYWAYTADYNVKSQKEYYFNAPYCLDYNYPNNARPTELWGQLRTVNKEVLSFNDIFLYSKDHVVYHTGKYIYNGNNKEWEGTSPFRSFGPVLGLVTDDMGVLISFFTSRNKKYVMMVNHDIHNKQVINMAWNSNCPIKHEGNAPISRTNDDSRLETFTDLSSESINQKISNVRNIHFVLQPGGYLLLSYPESLSY